MHIKFRISSYIIRRIETKTALAVKMIITVYFKYMINVHPPKVKKKKQLLHINQVLF